MTEPTMATACAAGVLEEQTCAIGPTAIVWPILERLKLIQHTNRYTGSNAALDAGRTLAAMVLNRLMAPTPLYEVEGWARHTVVPHVLGVSAKQLNDTHLARQFDSIHPVKHDLWQAVVTEAVTTYQVDLSAIHWDVTSFYFEGEYEQSEIVRYGYSRDKRPDAKQVILGLDVTSRDRVPLEFMLLPGQTADVKTPADNLEALKVLLNQPPLAELKVKPIVVSDCKMLFPEIIHQYHAADFCYLGPLPNQNDYETLIRSVPDEELQAHPLTYRPKRLAHDPTFEPYQGVERQISFEFEGKTVTDRALVVWSAGKARLDEQKRKTLLKRLLNQLAAIQQKLNTRRYKKAAYVLERIHTTQRGNAAKALVKVNLTGEDGALQLHFKIDPDKLAATQALDGKYVLATNTTQLTPDEILTLFKAQDRVEKRIATVKGRLRVRPMFLHKDPRIEMLAVVNLLALLVYAIIELQCRRNGVDLTARKVLEAFEYLNATVTTFADGSQWRRVDPLTDIQARVMHALQLPPVERYIAEPPLT